MKIIWTLAIVGLSAASSVQADNALAQASGCLACHAMETKLVGPTIKDIAAKYNGVEGATATLSAKVKTGGSGVWGPVPMPPSPAPEADVSAVVAWMLAQ